MDKEIEGEGAEFTGRATEEEDTVTRGAREAVVEDVEGPGGEAEAAATAVDEGGTDDAGGMEGATPLDVFGDPDGEGVAEDAAASVSGAGGTAEEEEEGPDRGLEEEDEWFWELFRE